MATKKIKSVLFLLLFILGACVIFVGVEILSVQARYAARRHENIAEFEQIMRDSNGCDQLCWLGLVPGRFNHSEFESFAHLAAERGYHLRNENQRGQFTTYAWEYGDLNYAVYVRFDDETLTEIEIVGTSIDDPSLIFEAYGTPTHYSSDIFYDIEAVVTTNFFYEDKGIILQFNGFYTSELEKDCKINPSTQLELWRITYVEPDDSNRMLEQARGDYSTWEYVQDWPGVDNLNVVGCKRLGNP